MLGQIIFRDIPEAAILLRRERGEDAVGIGAGVRGKINVPCAGKADRGVKLRTEQRTSGAG
jgi:hypothetical protein